MVSQPLRLQKPARYNESMRRFHLVDFAAHYQKGFRNHELGYRNNCAIRLASELRLLGLSMDETNDKLLEWNQRNGIELPADEIHSVIRSAYQHRFPYRYGCHDEILRHFCPLPDYEACRSFVASHAEERVGAKQRQRQKQ